MAAATLLNVPLATIKAVAEVEGSGGGFLATGQIKILFEPHIFWRQLQQRRIDPKPYAIKYASVLYEVWGHQPYGKTSQQWARLEKAAEINKEAAYCSASYGLFQPLGMYHKECGFDTVTAMVQRFAMNEGEQLMGFVRMIQARKLDDELRTQNWAAFALKYNGTGYKKNAYDIKLANAFKKHNI